MCLWSGEERDVFKSSCHKPALLCERTFRSQVSRREESQVLGWRRLVDLTRRDSRPSRDGVKVEFARRYAKQSKRGMKAVLISARTIKSLHHTLIQTIGSEARILAARLLQFSPGRGDAK